MDLFAVLHPESEGSELNFYTMKLFEKLFCKHNWETHSKTERELHHRITNEITVKYRDYTREVLICKNCGKIKIIDY